jgi:hypothetical protein
LVSAINAWNSIAGMRYVPDAMKRVTIGTNAPRIGYAPTSATPTTRKPTTVPSRRAPISTSCT